MMFPLENTRYLFNRDGKRVTPQDYQSEVIADIMGVKTGEGLEVCVEESEYMNLITKNDPKGKRVKPKSSIKLVEGQYVRVYPGKNLLMLEDSRVIKYFHDYNSMRFTDKYILYEDYYYVRTPVPHRLQYIKTAMGEYINVYLIKKITQGGVLFGVYKNCNNLMATDLKQVELAEYEDDNIVEKVDKDGSKQQILIDPQIMRMREMKDYYGPLKDIVDYYKK